MMDRPRRRRRSAVLVVAVLAWAGLGVGLAPKAAACGSYPNWTPDLCANEQKFVDDLASMGIKPTESPQGLADLGWKVCGDLFLGRTPEFEANRVYAYNVGLGGDGSRALVYSAIANLCRSAAGPHSPPPYPPQYNIP